MYFPITMEIPTSNRGRGHGTEIFGAAHRVFFMGFENGRLLAQQTATWTRGGRRLSIQDMDHDAPPPLAPTRHCMEESAYRSPKRHGCCVDGPPGATHSFVLRSLNAGKKSAHLPFAAEEAHFRYEKHGESPLDCNDLRL